ncbi:hypothetical protein OQA88_8798 [Cercophora sp. LCS_1]
MGDNKRKEAPTSGADQAGKKKKTGNAGKWKTPHHQAKQLDALQPGDQGIWVTCARHQEMKASKEVINLFTEYAEKLYGIKEKEPESDDEDDLEAAIQKEVAALNASAKGKADDSEDSVFTPMKMNIDCVLFVKTKAPVEPVEFVRRICIDAKDPKQGQLRCRYVNRLTPVTDIGKASETGLLEVARRTLAKSFKISESGTADGAASATEEKEGVDGKINPSTFAIRPTIRNHSNLKRDWVIQQTAALVDQDAHKVNLTTPDQVILIDIYQTVCGMSVVGSDWEALKRYNLTELYSAATK